MSSSQASRSIAAASFAVAVALAACNGHLDFGLGSRDAGSDGAMVRDGGGDALGGRGSSGAGGATGVVACAADGDCRMARLHCDLAGDRTCVECVTDDHCSTVGGAAGGAAGGLRCDTKARRCVACLTPAQCPATQTCVAGRCISTCVEDAIPATCAAGTKCESGLCAACETDNANPCSGTPATPYCLASPQICVACRGDADCAGGTRCDPVRKACVACIAAADCPATKPLCDLTTGTCF